MKKLLIISAVAFNLVSCEKYYFTGMVAPAGEDADGRFEQSMKYNANHGFQSVQTTSEGYLVYVFTDSHLNGETKNLDRFVNEYLQDNGAPLTLCLGDVVDGNEPFTEFISHTSRINEAGRKMFVTAGNHDLYWGRWSEYYKTFGSSTYWFEVVSPTSKDLFISVESGGGTLGTRQREWLEETLKTKRNAYRKTIVFTHTHFFMKDASQGHTSNYPIEETYDLLNLFSKYGVDVVLTGHDHSREQTRFKGVDYITVDAIEEGTENAAYAVLSIGKDTGISFVPLR